MSTKQVQKGSLKTKILFTYAVLAIVALGSIATAAGIFIGVVGNTASNQTSEQLTSQLQYSMQNKTHQIVQLVQSRFNEAANDLQSITTGFQRLWAIPRSELGNRTSYYDEDYIPAGTTLLNGTVTPKPLWYPNNVPTGAKYSARYQWNISLDYSAYLLWASAYHAQGNNLTNMNASMKDTLQRSAFIDFTMGQLMKEKPQYTWAYMEFWNGLERSMPWSGTDMYKFPPDNEDMRREPYVAGAVPLHGQIYWRSPYIDPSGQGQMITISQAVYNGSTFIGVNCMDITTLDINASVVNTHFYKNGFAFLINSTGFVVSYPYAHTVTDIQQLENNSIPATTLAAMKTGQTGVAEITKRGQQWYLAYEPVHVSDYVIGIMVPVDEVLAPVQALQHQVNVNLGIQLVIMLSILGLILVVSLWIGLMIANSVIQPIHRITNMALKLSTEDIKTTIKDFDAEFDREMKDDVQKDDEIGNLAKAFKNLVKAVQTENDTGQATAKES